MSARLELGAPVTVAAHLRRDTNVLPPESPWDPPSADRTWVSEPFPESRQGFVVGYRTLRNGRVDPGPTWVPGEAVPAYLVATSLSKAPVYVPLDALTPVAPAEVDPGVVGYYCSHEHEPHGAGSHVDRNHPDRREPNTRKALTLPGYRTDAPPPCPLAQPVRVVLG